MGMWLYCSFNATVQEMKLLQEKGCHIIDTTCPWVSKVWHTVEKHKKHVFTSIIHGNLSMRRLLLLAHLQESI